MKLCSKKILKLDNRLGMTNGIIYYPYEGVFSDVVTWEKLDEFRVRYNDIDSFVSPLTVLKLIR